MTKTETKTVAAAYSKNAQLVTSSRAATIAALTRVDKLGKAR